MSFRMQGAHGVMIRGGFVVARVLLLLGLFFGVSCERKILNFESNGKKVGEATFTPLLVVREEFNLSEENIEGRNCLDGGEAVAYVVQDWNGVRMRLANAPAGGCISPGDEVLLIQTQGTELTLERVGRQELLVVAELAQDTIVFSESPTQAYGHGTKDDWEAKDSRIIVQRVPRFSSVHVLPGAVLTASSWREGSTGILALRSEAGVLVDGDIDMSAAGFQGGAESPDSAQQGSQGESILGKGIASTLPNAGGGGGGLGDQEREGCVQDGNAGGGGGHLENGEAASVLDFCDGEGRGLGGHAYASEGKIFLGSGGGSGGMDNIIIDNPPGAPGGDGGGIVWLLAESIEGTGLILSRGAAGEGDASGEQCTSGRSVEACYDHSGTGGGGAGGTVRLEAPQISGVTIDVRGGVGGNGLDSAGGDGGMGSSGVEHRPFI